MSRLPAQSVSIPNPAYKAAGITMAALRRNGIDPRAAIINPTMRQICVAWAHGELDDAGFDNCCRNMLIMNPGLACK